jgi:Protein of unknown function (DUF998)
MTTNVSNPTVPTTTTTAARAEATDARTRALLICGAVAGPLFIVVAVAQALTRTGFDPSKHPLSLLSLGGAGWIQITNFVVTGLLFVAAAIGMRRALRRGRAGTWGPRLIGAFGGALVAGGVFLSDPGLGFPAGAPEGIPDKMSWHAMVHAAAPVIGFLALSLACFVFARRAFARNNRGWAVFSVAIGIGIQALGVISNATLNFLPLGAAMVLGFGWASVQVARLLAEHRAA